MKEAEKRLAGRKFADTKRINNLTGVNYERLLLVHEGLHMVDQIKQAADDWLRREMLVDLRGVDTVTVRVTTIIELVGESDE